jgi:hypothetical protein
MGYRNEAIQFLETAYIPIDYSLLVNLKHMKPLAGHLV